MGILKTETTHTSTYNIHEYYNYKNCIELKLPVFIKDKSTALFDISFRFRDIDLFYFSFKDSVFSYNDRLSGKDILTHLNDNKVYVLKIKMEESVLTYDLTDVYNRTLVSGTKPLRTEYREFTSDVYVTVSIGSSSVVLHNMVKKYTQKITEAERLSLDDSITLKAYYDFLYTCNDYIGKRDLSNIKNGEVLVDTPLQVEVSEFVYLNFKRRSDGRLLILNGVEISVDSESVKANGSVIFNSVSRLLLSRTDGLVSIHILDKEGVEVKYDYPDQEGVSNIVVCAGVTLYKVLIFETDDYTKYISNAMMHVIVADFRTSETLTFNAINNLIFPLTMTAYGSYGEYSGETTYSAVNGLSQDAVDGLRYSMSTFGASTDKYEAFYLTVPESDGVKNFEMSIGYKNLHMQDNNDVSRIHFIFTDGVTDYTFTYEQWIYSYHNRYYHTLNYPGSSNILSLPNPRNHYQEHFIKKFWINQTNGKFGLEFTYKNGTTEKAELEIPSTDYTLKKIQFYKEGWYSHYEGITDISIEY